MNALSEALQGARRIVFFGGAGVSVPSGIPDFRGENGLYAKEYDGLTAEMLLSHSFFCLHPDIFYDFYKKHMLYPNAKPNIVHVRLAEMERMGRVTAVVTQNIDGQHKKALRAGFYPEIARRAALPGMRRYRAAGGHALRRAAGSLVHDGRVPGNLELRYADCRGYEPVGRTRRVVP